MRKAQFLETMVWTFAWLATYARTTQRENWVGTMLRALTQFLAIHIEWEPTKIQPFQFCGSRPHDLAFFEAAANRGNNHTQIFPAFHFSLPCSPIDPQEFASKCNSLIIPECIGIGKLPTTSWNECLLQYLFAFFIPRFCRTWFHNMILGMLPTFANFVLKL